MATPKAYNLIKKETLTQVFSSEFCEVFENTFFAEQLRTNASELLTISLRHKATRDLRKPKFSENLVL